MTHTKHWAIALVVLCTVFTSVGALLLKKGVDRFGGLTLEGFIAAYPVLIGLFFYFLGFVMLTIAFRHGELSTLFPFVSLSFVWVAIFSWIFLKELLGLFEILGVAAIVAGVVMIGVSGRNSKGKARGLRLRA